MELADYNITFVHIKGKNNPVADENIKYLSRTIWRNPQVQVVNNTQQVVANMCH